MITADGGTAPVENSRRRSLLFIMFLMYFIIVFRRQPSDEVDLVGSPRVEVIPSPTKGVEEDSIVRIHLFQVAKTEEKKLYYYTDDPEYIPPPSVPTKALKLKPSPVVTQRHQDETN
eukprot:TRINITY_DN8740_c0_g1_i1.p1 TRINITY_DN8740_c0_g1~~TRINITY_DN8740_c0_g1_i1.p1  ORF type:complete len:117 (+),score=40.30 TRINITY_DN8740_c0_g1_i1:24-374(+)